MRRNIIGEKKKIQNESIEMQLFRYASTRGALYCRLIENGIYGWHKRRYGTIFNNPDYQYYFDKMRSFDKDLIDIGFREEDILLRAIAFVVYSGGVFNISIDGKRIVFEPISYTNRPFLNEFNEPMPVAICTSHDAKSYKFIINRQDCTYEFIFRRDYSLRNFEFMRYAKFVMDKIYNLSIEESANSCAKMMEIMLKWDN